MPHQDCMLLALPDALLREVNSWCPNAASAAALHNTCRSARQLRHNAAAAALLLLRCRCTSYATALHSYGRRRLSALLHHLQQLLRAGTVASGPHAAPPLLLAAMLAAACGRGDTALVESLLALPQPPDVNAGEGAAMTAALAHGHLDVLRLLLQSGASPCAASDHEAFLIGHGPPGPFRLAAVQLLLQHCPPAHAAAARDAAFRGAGMYDCTDVAALLLSTASAGSDGVQFAAITAAMNGSLAVLQLLLRHHPPDFKNLGVLLVMACLYCRCNTAALLLGQGAGINSRMGLTCPLEAALGVLPGPDVDLEFPAVLARGPMVRLLLQRGVAVTQAARDAAAALGVPGLQALLALGG